jgi:hypothetical protein
MKMGAKKPLKPYRHLGCPELTEDRFCPEHMKEYNWEEKGKVYTY